VVSGGLWNGVDHTPRGRVPIKKGQVTPALVMSAARRQALDPPNRKADQRPDCLR